MAYPSSEFGVPPTDGIGRVLTILEGISELGTSASLAEITRRTRLPKTTVFRLLRSLERCEVVQRCDSGYMIGDRIRALVAPSKVGNHYRLLIPHLADLYEALHLSVSLAVLVNMKVRYVQTIYPKSHTQPISRTSQDAPAHCTAAGKVMLAHSPGALSRYPMEQSLLPFTPSTITDWSTLMLELAQIRENGVAASREEYVAGYVSLAVALRSNGDESPVALSAAGPKSDFDFTTVDKALRRIAISASQTLRIMQR